jgi:hypothetical protein
MISRQKTVATSHSAVGRSSSIRTTSFPATCLELIPALYLHDVEPADALAGYRCAGRPLPQRVLLRSLQIFKSIGLRRQLSVVLACRIVGGMHQRIGLVFKNGRNIAGRAAVRKSTINCYSCGIREDRNGTGGIPIYTPPARCCAISSTGTGRRISRRLRLHHPRWRRLASRTISRFKRIARQWNIKPLAACPRSSSCSKRRDAARHQDHQK